jgi:hypothetical protein
MIWEVGQDCRLLPVSHASTRNVRGKFKPAPRCRPRHATDSSCGEILLRQYTRRLDTRSPNQHMV